PEGAALRVGDDQRRGMVEPDVDGAGGELLDRVARAVATAQVDVEPLLRERALVLGHEPGSVIAAEGEFQCDRDLLGRARAVGGDEDREDTAEERESGGHAGLLRWGITVPVPGA